MLVQLVILSLVVMRGLEWALSYVCLMNNMDAFYDPVCQQPTGCQGDVRQPEDAEKAVTKAVQTFGCVRPTGMLVNKSVCSRNL